MPPTYELIVALAGDIGVGLAKEAVLLVVAAIGGIAYSSARNSFRFDARPDVQRTLISTRTIGGLITAFVIGGWFIPYSTERQLVSNVIGLAMLF